MIAKRRVLINAVTSVVQVVATGGTLFFLYRYLISAIGAEDFGVWALVMAWTSASAIASLGLVGSAVKFVSQYLARGDEARVVAVVQTATLSVGAFLAGALLVLYPLLRMVLAAVIEPASSLPAAMAVLPYALASFWLSSVAGVLLSCIDGYQRVDLRNVLVTLAAAVYLVAAFALVPGGGLIGLAEAQVMQAGLLLVAAWVLVRRLLPVLPLVPWQWDQSAFREMLRYSLNFQVISLAQMFFEPVTKSLVSKFGGVGVVAYFEMAQKMVVQLRALIAVAHRSLVPTLADLHERNPALLETVYAKSYRLLLFLVLPSLPLLIALSPFVSELWLGTYEPLFMIFAALLFTGWFLNLLSIPAYIANLGTGHLRWNVWGHVTIGVLNGILGGLLGWLYGPIGVVVGFVTALLAGSVLIALAYQRAHSIRARDLVQTDSLWLGLAGVVGSALILTLYSIYHDVLNLFVLGALMVSVYLVVIALPLWRHPVRRQLYGWLLHLVPGRKAETPIETPTGTPAETPTETTVEG